MLGKVVLGPKTGKLGGRWCFASDFYHVILYYTLVLHLFHVIPHDSRWWSSNTFQAKSSRHSWDKLGTSTQKLTFMRIFFPDGLFETTTLVKKHPPGGRRGRGRKKPTVMKRHPNGRLRAGRIRWRLVSIKVWPWYRCLWKDVRDDERRRPLCRFVVVSFFFRIWSFVRWLVGCLGLKGFFFGYNQRMVIFFGEVSDVFFWGWCFGTKRCRF